MGLRDDGGSEDLPPPDPGIGHATGPICSLNEAWLYTLDRCGTDIPLSEVILPLLRICFFYGAMHAVLLLDNGHDAQLAADIVGFLRG
jgi:hypothetical protein